MNKKSSGHTIKLEIPDLQFKAEYKTNSLGAIKENIKINAQLWSPANPKLYEIKISSDAETY